MTDGVPRDPDRQQVPAQRPAGGGDPRPTRAVPVAGTVRRPEAPAGTVRPSGPPAETVRPPGPPAETVRPPGPPAAGTVRPSGPPAAGTVRSSGPPAAGTVRPSGPPAETVRPPGPPAAGTVRPPGPPATAAGRDPGPGDLASALARDGAGRSGTEPDGRASARLRAGAAGNGDGRTATSADPPAPPARAYDLAGEYATRGAIDPWSNQTPRPGGAGRSGGAAPPAPPAPPWQPRTVGGRSADASSDRSPIRYRVFPRSLLGITAMILSLSVGAAFSGVVLFSYYQYKLDQTNTNVNSLVKGYGSQFKNAEHQLQAAANLDKNQITNLLGPFQKLAAQGDVLAQLVKSAGPSVYLVVTTDQAGQPSVGSAFVVASTSSQSLLLTSYTTVQAATQTPAPQVQVQQGTARTTVTLRTWDQANDLALIVLNQGNLPVLHAAPASPAPSIGERVFALSGLGAAGGSISQGAVTEVSADGMEHNTPVNASYQGGPLLDSSGKVVGVTSLTYSPLNFPVSGVYFSPLLQAACQKVLSCPGGSISSSS
ncbi:MAG: trypsin-like peptidase domain-containing protein [Acidimicrobiales bacterium]